ncbi:MAG: aminotransferase class V-fold PLP-dependent enzyme [Acidimicrobiaceae bacterium]|nr:aminotransferase class V-fold PLP-dependent enzyme [Acidimicrobiia bacterium]MCY4493766.1 aminotransferase class V-fold PLP-dependent enzyme [Acidimicrobiaceae bacterium]
MPTSEVYLDHAASTVVRAASKAAWAAAVEAHHANPTGAHKAARSARRALDDARDLIAEMVGRDPAEAVFTSGGSEADNLAVRGVLAARGGTAVCSAGEHHAVLEPVEHADGLTVGLDAKGQVTPQALADTLKAADDVSVVSIIAVNNETGAVNDLPALAQVVREHAPGALFHTDAVQALSWIDLAPAVADVDMVSITGHKVGGPIGTGVLFVRAGIELEAQILGGGQERGRRAGTPDVAGAAAFAAAVKATVERRPDEVVRLGGLRDRLVDGLVDRLGSAVVPTLLGRGHDSEVAAGIAHICLDGVEAEALLFLLDAQGLRASAASSCSSGAQDPSHVLAAMGVPRELAAGSLRLSLGHSSTPADVETALEIIPPAVKRLLRHGGG